MLTYSFVSISLSIKVLQMQVQITNINRIIKRNIKQKRVSIDFFGRCGGVSLTFEKWNRAKRYEKYFHYLLINFYTFLLHIYYLFILTYFSILWVGACWESVHD